MIKNLWKNWCKKVDEHNERLTYADQEECWNPYFIFVPFTFSIIVIIVGIYIKSSIFAIIINWLLFNTVAYLFSYLNWILFDKKEKSKEEE